MGKSFIKRISEGKASFYASIDSDNKISKELGVFYNPVMKFNRDISIALLNSLNKKGMGIADIMAGSGIRSLRFMLELNNDIIGNLTVNDYSQGFVKLFKKNIGLNKIRKSLLKDLYIQSMDANQLILSSKGFDYIDIDPFGSPNDFLENSIVRLSRGGILAVTATDTAPLAGTFPDTCMRKYWAKPMRNHMMHEIGLRILIRKCQLVAASHEKAIMPLIAYFKDHYFRIFFICEKGKKKSDEVLKQHRYFMYCNNCMSSKISEFNNDICDECNNAMIYAGPMWVGQLNDVLLLKKLYSYIIKQKDISHADKNFISTIIEESKIPIAGFYDMAEIFSRAKKPMSKSDTILELIKSENFSVSKTHFSPYGLRTNMPPKKWKDILRKLQ